MAGSYKFEGEGDRPGSWGGKGVGGTSGSRGLVEGIDFRSLSGGGAEWIPKGEKEGLVKKVDKGKGVDRQEKDTSMGLGEGKNTEQTGLGDSKHAGHECENKKCKREGEERGGEVESLGIDGWADREERRILGKIREEEEKKKSERKSKWEEYEVDAEEGENMIRDFRRWQLKMDKMAQIIEVGELDAKLYSLDVMLRNVLREVGSREGKRGTVEVEKERESKKEEEKLERVRVGKKEELEQKIAVEGGRSYREVVIGGKPGMKSEELKRMEEKKEKEREAERVACLEREKRLENVVEVVMDSQDEGLKEGEKWDVEAVGKALGMKEGVIKEISGKGCRVRIRCDSEKGVEEVKEVKKEVWEEVMRRKVVQMKSLDQWAGIVIPGVELKDWDGKLKDLRRKVELENNIKLMKDPVWLVHPIKARGMRLERVGVICHVAKESLRQELLKEGIVGGDKKVEVKRFVGSREVQWCTKCAVMGHSWWNYGKKETCCSVCAVKGHTGWQHRCQRCNVARVPCKHYRKRAMCGGPHSMKEAREGNCPAIRMEMARLRSLN
ncbi:hypothetical protein L873DRAFT_1795917 [Choiromyces venosus 120613-1]|uniref:Uncharacterized protein n=1 Tax=Choiromyces venosus 120613-1 TaxID=1336337 RepID=A0A3N4IVB6_9PEZI|nr:hypothetical protein L873DRAFT_1795917 [Choiromyces venosus 120613-1]